MRDLEPSLQRFGEFLGCAHLLAQKNPRAGLEIGRFWVFPSQTLSVDPRADVVRRHHVSDSVVQKAVKTAVRTAGIHKPFAGNDEILAVEPDARHDRPPGPCAPPSQLIQTSPGSSLGERRSSGGPRPEARWRPLECRLPHWSFAEMRAAFGWTVEELTLRGGYPGAAPLAARPVRWRRYVLDSLVETTIARDVLLLTRVDNPALLRRLFELGCRYSGQVLSYTKMLGQLHGAGNTTTLAHYLDLLAGAGMLAGIPKYSGSQVRQRGSSPKLQVLNTALMTAIADIPSAPRLRDPAIRGRLTGSAVGAHLANAAAAGDCELFYWRDRNREVDFIVRNPRRLVAIEVKSGRARDSLPGTDAFAAAYAPDRVLLVGAEGIPLESFLERPVADWLRG